MIERTKNGTLKFREKCPRCGTLICRILRRLRVDGLTHFYTGSSKQGLVNIDLETECHKCGKAVHFVVETPRSRVL